MLKLLRVVGSFFSGFFIGMIAIWIFNIDTSEEGKEILAALPTMLGVLFLIVFNLDIVGVKVPRPWNR